MYLIPSNWFPVLKKLFCSLDQLQNNLINILKNDK